MWRLHLSSLYVGHICIIKRPRSLHLFIFDIIGRFWNMLATAVLGGANTEINQVLWASKLQTNSSIKLLIEINPAIRG